MKQQMDRIVEIILSNENSFYIFCILVIIILYLLFAIIGKICDTIKIHAKNKILEKMKFTTKITSKGVINYYAYVSKEHELINYKLQAEVKVITARTYAINIPVEFQKKAQLVSYELQRIYWGNGGYISFVPETPDKNYTIPDLIIGKEVQVISTKGEIYNVKLTDEIIEESIPQLYKVKKEQEYLINTKKAVSHDIKKLLSDTKHKHEYFAELLADYREYLNLKIADELKNKQRPALKASEEVKQLSKKYRILEKDFRMLKYQLDMYEKVFPWITEFKELSIREIKEIKNENTEIRSERQYLSSYISPDEYNKLSQVEKYQLALDRYRRKEKSNWQIGIEFERYIGYLYETKGYKVTYYGAKKGLEDLGRDLIVSKDDNIIVIQCKNWSKDKTIHEKHIFQLFGTMFALNVEKNKNNNKIILENETIEFNNIFGEFITTTSLSNTARLYADKLNINVRENVEFDKNYPCIKCNIGKNGEKIYHLPFDQQYDNIIIDASKGECYVHTIQEAEDLGFRHAYMWHTNN